MQSPNGSIHGRGAAENPKNRFERLSVETSDDFPDGLGCAGGDGNASDHETAAGTRRKKTEFYRDNSRTILSANDSPDIPFSISINPYRGCEHGCIYCYARPTHEYLGLSAGLDFETKVFVKEDAPELLRAALSKPSYEPRVITLSGVTDCYQPVERKLELTRRCLQTLAEFGNPFTTISKNHLVTRDLDIIAPMADKNAAACFITLTTLDPELCAVLEPRTSRPAHRLDAIRRLRDAGVPVGVMLAPIIPGLTDHEIPALLGEAARAGARTAAFVPLRLPYGLAAMFEDWLARHRPEHKSKVLHRVQSIRGGKLNDPRLGSRMRGEGPFADQMRAMFKLYARREGLNRVDIDLTTSHFRVPPAPPRMGDQMAWF